MSDGLPTLNKQIYYYYIYIYPSSGTTGGFLYNHDNQMSCSSQLESENNIKKKKCLNQSFGFILPKGRLTVVLLAQSGVTGGYFVTV